MKDKKKWLELQGNADRLPGVRAAQMARLTIIIALCGFQYWLLASTMEAYHSGNQNVVYTAFIVSILCFALAIGLVVTGEVGLKKLNQEMENESVK